MFRNNFLISSTLKSKAFSIIFRIDTYAEMAAFLCNLGLVYGKILELT